MTNEEAYKAKRDLEKIAKRGNYYSTLNWIALAEDTLRSVLPVNSQLLARLDIIKKEAGLVGPEENSTGKPMGSIETEFQGVIQAAGDLIENLATGPVPPPDRVNSIEEEVNRAILKGYFKSWPFRVVVGLLGLLLLLITGVSGVQMYTQVQAMKTLVAEANKAVNEAHEQVIQAKSEIANRRAEMALLVLQGDADLLKARTEAGRSLEDARSRNVEELKNKTVLLSGDLETAKTIDVNLLGKKTSDFSRDFDDIEKQDRSAVAKKFQTVMQNLEASRRPWIPVVAASIAKRWLILPFVLVVSFLTWAYAAVNGWANKVRWIKVVTVLNFALLLGIGIAIYVLA
jgi:hypothetical protein